MTTPKQSTEAMLAALPDDASFDNIHYRLYVLEKLEAGMAELEAGQGIAHEDIKAQLAAWRAR